MVVRESTRMKMLRERERESQETELARGRESVRVLSLICVFANIERKVTQKLFLPS